MVWFITSLAVHSYIKYWWNCIKKIEADLSLKDCSFATEHPGSGLHPSLWVHVIPVLFLMAWVVILVFAIHGLLRLR
jgi:hypothetical protein